MYFVERAGGAVRSVPIQGGAVADAASVGGSPSGIAVAGSDLFWADFGQARLSRAPLEGGPPMTVSSTPGKSPAVLATAADRIVVAAVGATGEIQQYGFDLVPGPSFATTNNPWDLAVSGGDIYWTDPAGAAIWRAQTGSSQGSQLATGENECRSIAADGSGVYWARLKDGLVRAMLDSSDVVLTLATVEKSPTSLAADASGVYWLTADGKLRRSNRNETPLSTLAQGFLAPPADQRIKGIALTSKFVVWITADGKVLRHDK